MDPKFPLSYSSINKFRGCPLSYYYKISGKKVEYVPDFFITGRERHKLIYEMGMLVKQGYSVMAAKDIAIARVAPKRQSNIKELKRVKTNLAYDDSVFLEHRMTVDKSYSKKGRRFVGILDYLRINEEDDEALVVDYKGGVILPSYEIQAKLYAGLVAAIYGVSKIVVKMFQIPLNRYGKDVLVISKKDAIEFLKEYVESSVRDISGLKKEDISPVVGDECNVCGYRNSCPAMLSILSNAKSNNLAKMTKKELSALKSMYKAEIEKISILIGGEKRATVKLEKDPEDVHHVMKFFEEMNVDPIKENIIVVDEKTLSRILRDFRLEVVYEKEKNNAK